MVFVATVLGVISPKIKRIKVTIIVINDITVAKLNKFNFENRSKKKAVANDVAAIFAILFPIRIQVSSRLGFLSKNSSFLALVFLLIKI